jgi:hypothetical protein
MVVIVIIIIPAWYAPFIFLKRLPEEFWEMMISGKNSPGFPNKVLMQKGESQSYV